ncbi:MAG: DUF4190 domain-containing protein [Ilumatobacteraceae bacterium]
MSNVPTGADGGGPQGGYPAGWYPLPDGRSERYWDGTMWTDGVRPVAPVGSGAVPPPPPFPGSFPSTFPPAFPPAFPQSAAGLQMAAGQAKNDGMAIASMVLGIVSLVIPCVGVITGLIGLVLGIISLGRVQPRGERLGRGMAIAGIVCSSIALMLYVGFLLLVLGSGS